MTIDWEYKRDKKNLYHVFRIVRYYENGREVDYDEEYIDSVFAYSAEQACHFVREKIGADKYEMDESHEIYFEAQKA